MQGVPSFRRAAAFSLPIIAASATAASGCPHGTSQEPRETTRGWSLRGRFPETARSRRKARATSPERRTGPGLAQSCRSCRTVSPQLVLELALRALGRDIVEKDRQRTHKKILRCKRRSFDDSLVFLVVYPVHGFAIMFSVECWATQRIRHSCPRSSLTASGWSIRASASSGRMRLAPGCRGPNGWSRPDSDRTAPKASIAPIGDGRDPTRPPRAVRWKPVCATVLLNQLRAIRHFGQGRLAGGLLKVPLH